MKRQCHFSVIIKCGKITVTHWELDIFYFTFYLFGGGCVCTQRTLLPTGLNSYVSAYHKNTLKLVCRRLKES